jgi:hypothetical protein
MIVEINPEDHDLNHGRSVFCSIRQFLKVCGVDDDGNEVEIPEDVARHLTAIDTECHAAIALIDEKLGRSEN